MKSLGFTFDEKILKEMCLEAFFDNFPTVDALEIAPDELLLPKKDYKKIISHTESHNFHVPYFVSEMKYDFSSEYFKKDYTKFFSIIESLRQYSVKTPSMIVHGATVLDSRTKAFEATKRGIDYLLNFIEQKKIDTIITLETLQRPFIGTTEELLELHQLFDHPRFSLCFDIHHVKENEAIIPSKEFLDQTSYVHLHHDHGSIQKLPKEWLIDLDAHYNIELLMHFCKNYRQTLIDDIHYIKTI